MATRVAVIGASGIGKHHAKWWALDGAEVCAFVGTSEASTAKTREALRQLFGFQGRAYTDLAALLEAERPDVVDVCSPNAFHYAQTLAALRHGCHVLCEKPLVFDPAAGTAAVLARAGELVALARERGLRLGVCTQYVLAARTCLALWQARPDSRPPTRCLARLASPHRNRPPEPGPVWIDLGPHLLSIAATVAPGAVPRWDTLVTDFRGYDARAQLVFARPDGPDLACDLVTGRTLGGGGPTHIRQIELDDVRYVLEGENDAGGVYRSRIDAADGSQRGLDFMHGLIREFGQGRPVVEGAAALANLEWTLRILDHAGRG